MKKLTAQQERFAQAIADGMTQADAYRTAYKAGTSKPETVWKRASELMENGAVAGRVAELRKALADKALWTREKSVQALSAIAEEGRPLERVAAVKELNAMHGFNAPSKAEVTHLLPRTVRIVALSGD